MPMGNRISLCSHGSYAAGLLDAASMIAGSMEQVAVFSLQPGVDPFAYRASIEAYLDSHADDDILCLVDLFGSTPSNMFASLSARNNIEVVAGVNLATLIEVVIRSDQVSLAELCDMALQAIYDGAIDVKQRLKKTVEGKKEPRDGRD